MNNRMKKADALRKIADGFGNQKCTGQEPHNAI